MTKNKNIFILGLIIILGGIVYLYKIVPSEIRKECFADASKSAIEDTNPPLYQDSQDRIVRMQLQNQLIGDGYLNCVREKGLAN